jgi:hypothetical protein
MALDFVVRDRYPCYRIRHPHGRGSFVRFMFMGLTGSNPGDAPYSARSALGLKARGVLL